MPLKSDEIRRLFIEFFKSKPAPGPGGHTFVPSSPAIPHEDPTLLFTNAGMNQFKPLFLGQAAPGSALSKLRRAVNSQKCIRAGGKHNDLDDVGKDTYHHTFFEMLGNWSFGDYFKQESIDWAWELLTKVYGIPPERLYATYFMGNPAQGLEPDHEARALWRKYLPESRIIPGNMKDNFWEMGDTGPCGPCSEIHVDRIGGRDAAALVNTGDPDVIEIWNLVFIQFNREEGGVLKPLPAKHVDTGMGFERLTSVLQNVRSNYDTDVFTPLFAAIERVTGCKHPYRGKVGAADKDNVDTAYRVIADHIRTLTFAITDGAIPSNEGRGYVLRRILRRAVRYGRQMLGAKTGFFSQLVPVVVENMGEFFPELRKNPQRVIEILREEEESFGRTLERGIVLFDEACLKAFSRARLIPHLQAAGAKASLAKNDHGQSTLVIDVPHTPHLGGRFLPGEMNPAWADAHFGPQRGIDAEDAFKLYDTFGFPLDLTVLMAEERGLKVDLDGFHKLMDEARERARAGGRFADAASDIKLPPDAIARLKHMGIEPTDDLDKFHGREIRARVCAIWDGADFDEHALAGTSGLNRIGVILDRSNFYAEMGGQVGDEGRLVVSRESKAGSRDSAEHGAGEFRVEDTRSFGGYVVHIGRVVKREIRVGDEVILHLDAQRRGAIAANHTATHLLNLALARNLGAEVHQKGSMVAPDRFRFDFSHNKPVAPEELVRIEHEVRANVKHDLPVHAEVAPLNLARQIHGLRAVFGEAYPDPVRVVSIGKSVKDALSGAVNASALDFSIEFCGGTHVSRTSEIGHFSIIAEEAVAKGVRRLTALTGVPAMAAEQAGTRLEQRIFAAQGLSGPTLPGEVQQIIQELDSLTIPLTTKQRLRLEVATLQEKVKAAAKAASAGRQEQVVAAAKRLAESSEFDAGSSVVATIDAGSDRDALTAAMNTIRTARPRHAVMLISTDQDQGKLSILAGVPDTLIKRGLNAGEWVRVAAAACGGKGGGKPDNAQGGGTDLAKLKDVLAAAKAHAFGKAPN
jgi:alanyl-tRNA synthetase